MRKVVNVAVGSNSDMRQAFVSNDLVDATDLKFIFSKAANRRSWTVDCASFPIQLTCTLRTEFWRWCRLRIF